MQSMLVESGMWQKRENAQQHRKEEECCTEALCSVPNLICSQSWDCLNDYLSTERGVIEISGLDILGKDVIGTTLHLLCQNSPTLETVQKVVLMNPYALYQSDPMGRTPLHVAAAHHLSLNVISFLILAFPPAVSMLDMKGKTPLILLCENFQRYESFLLAAKGYEIEDIFWAGMQDLIRVLCDANPMSVIMEDNDGLSALEHAIMTNARLETVQLLMRRTKNARVEAASEEANKKGSRHLTAAQCGVQRKIPEAFCHAVNPKKA